MATRPSDLGFALKAGARSGGGGGGGGGSGFGRWPHGRATFAAAAACRGWPHQALAISDGARGGGARGVQCHGDAFAATEWRDEAAAR
jgi:hypothetical protein